jgi:hypothetical protein
LETLLHKLVRGLMEIGAAAGNCTRTSSVAGRHSAVKSQPQESKRAGSNHAPGPRHFNKEQTPLGDLLDPNPRFHGGSFGVLGHTSCEALKL